MDEISLHKNNYASKQKLSFTEKEQWDCRGKKQCVASKVEGGAQMIGGFVSVLTMDQVLETRCEVEEMRGGPPRLLIRVKRYRGMGGGSGDSENSSSAASWDEVPRRGTRSERQVGTVQCSAGCCQGNNEWAKVYEQWSEEVY